VFFYFLFFIEGFEGLEHYVTFVEFTPDMAVKLSVNHLFFRPFMIA